QGHLYTAYEVLEKRFGTATRRASSLLFLVTRNLGDGLRLFLAGIVLEQLLNWSFIASVMTMGTVTVLYTVVGGLRSVVWNDCIQFVIYVLGGLAAVYVIAGQIDGGWQQILSFAETHGKLNPLNFTWKLSDPFTFWAGLFGGAVLTIGTHGTDHMMVQRYLSARSQADAGRAVLCSGVVVLLQFALFLFIGIELACFYAQPGRTAPETSDRIFVSFIVEHFPANVGLIGLMLAAILSAAMSTLSSSLNASASAVLNDFWIPLSRTKPDDAGQLKVSRMLTVAFGLLQVGIAIQAAHLQRSVVSNALAIAGFSAGILLGVFLLGVLSRRVGQRSALLGATVGLVVLCVVQFGPLYVPGLAEWKVAWPWFALIGAATTYFAGAAAAYVRPDRGQDSGDTSALNSSSALTNRP
ncbi:MAG: transporter, partial [Planctomycetaceae bacterium]|nr:transporter [Planctomycetaceae bacterium]